MKKKFLIVALSIVAASCAFVACGEDSLGDLIPDEGSDSASEYVMQERSVSYVGVIDGVIGEIPANMKDLAGSYPTKYMEGEGAEIDSLINAGQYAFDGWYTDEACGNLFGEIDGDTRGDITLYAKISTLKYAVSYKAVLNGEVCEIPEQMWDSEGSYPTEYIYSVGATVSDLLDYQLNGQTSYIFDGWYTDSECFESITGIDTERTGALTLYAKVKVYSAIIYKAVVDDVECEIPSQAYKQDGKYPSVYSEGAGVEIDSLVAYGQYAFDKWYTDLACTNEFKGIDNDTRGAVTLYAKITTRKFGVSYKAVLNGAVIEVPEQMWDSEGSYPTEYIYSVGASVSNLLDYALDGQTKYVFGGWYLESECTTKFTNILATQEGKLTLYAKIEENATGAGIQYKMVTHSGIFAVDGNMLADGGNYPQEYNYGAEIAISDLVEYKASDARFVFVGWYLDEACQTEFEGITQATRGDIILYAKVKIGRTIAYKAVVDGVEGEIPADMQAGDYPTEYFEGENTQIDSLIAHGQYVFNNWYTDSACTALFKGIDKNTQGSLTLYAKITTLEYSVLYKGVLEGEVIEIPEQMWDSEGSYPTEYIYSVGAPVSDLLRYDFDSRHAYIFKGWYLEIECVTKVTNIESTQEGALTLYAKIEVNATGADIEYKMVSHFGVSDTVNANMYANGGNYPDEYEYGVETAISDLVEYQTASGRYAFGGWYLDEACTLVFGGITENTRGKLTLYAKVDAYMSIAYKAVIDGTAGEVPADMGAGTLAKEYLVGGTLTLQDLTETADKDFLGWYEDEACNTPFVGTGKVSAFTAYAKIQTKAGVTYYVVKDGQQVALEGAWKKTDGAYPTEYNYGTDTVVDGLQETFVIEGTTYKFVGWYTDATCSVAFKGITAQSRGAITLYAKIDQGYAISYFVVYKGETRAMSKISGVPTWYTKGMSVTVPNKTYYEETYSEYTLTGIWYTDEACTQEFKGISATQTGDLKLYAKATKMDAWTPLL